MMVLLGCVQVYTTPAAALAPESSSDNPLVVQHLAIFDSFKGVIVSDADSQVKAPMSSAPFANGVSTQHIPRAGVCSKCGQLVGWMYDPKGSKNQRGRSTATEHHQHHHHHQHQQHQHQHQEEDAPLSPHQAGVASAGKPQAIPYVLSEELQTLSPLAGKCFELHTGWWSYKMCYRSEAFQYHRESSGSNNPIWSIGKFDRYVPSSTIVGEVETAPHSVFVCSQGRIERARPLSAEVGYYTSHFFTGGQICHETGKGRATEVQFFCCAKPTAMVRLHVRMPLHQRC